MNEATDEIDDMITTNNSDREKVLATVAGTVLDFLNNYSGTYVFAQGSTPSRTRLYQMGISSYWDEIRSQFVVFGYLDGTWNIFKKGINYQAFLIKHKRLNLSVKDVL